MKIKDSKKKSDSKKKLNFYYSIIDSIRKGKSMKQIADSLNISKQNLNYLIYPLKVYKAINKIGKGVWEVNQENFKRFLSKKIVKKVHRVGTEHTPKEIRSHAFVFTTRLKNISKWNRRKNYLNKKKISYKDIPQGQRIKVNNFKIWLCDKSIVIYFPKDKSYFNENANKGYLRAVYDYKAIMLRLENLFNTNFKISKNWQFRLSRQHHSLIKNALAKKYRKEKKKFYCPDEHGKVWLLADYSFNIDELELIDSKKSERDTDEVIYPFFNDLRNKEHYLPSQTRNIAITTLGLVYELANAQLTANKQLQTIITLLTPKKPKDIVPEERPDYFG